MPLISYLELLEICAELLDDPLFGSQYEPRHAGVVGNIRVPCSGASRRPDSTIPTS